MTSKRVFHPPPGVGPRSTRTRTAGTPGYRARGPLRAVLPPMPKNRTTKLSRRLPFRWFTGQAAAGQQPKKFAKAWGYLAR